MIGRLIVLCVLLCPATFAGTWAMVQHPNNAACGNVTTCNITVTSTTGANLGVVTAHMGGASISITSVTGGGTWTLCSASACNQSDATAGSVDFAYNLNLGAGATTITVNFSATIGAGDAGFLEYSTTAGPPIFDNAGKRGVTVAAANLAGATVGALTGTNDVIVQSGTFSGTASACGTQGGTNNNPNDFPAGNATCGFINTTTTTANTYTNTSARASLAVIAFKETAGGATCSNRMALMGAGQC